jgi:hypothetical protein
MNTTLKRGELQVNNSRISSGINGLSGTLSIGCPTVELSLGIV